MRLIDADELIKRIGKWMPKDPCGKEQTIEEVVATNIAVSVCMEIEETPTAFDKENVLDELKGEIELVVHKPMITGRYIKKSRAIEIVEKGGIE